MAPKEQKLKVTTTTVLKNVYELVDSWMGTCGNCSQGVLVPKETGKTNCGNCGAIVIKK